VNLDIAQFRLVLFLDGLSPMFFRPIFAILFLSFQPNQRNQEYSKDYELDEDGFRRQAQGRRNAVEKGDTI